MQDTRTEGDNKAPDDVRKVEVFLQPIVRHSCGVITDWGNAPGSGANWYFKG